MTLNEEDKTKHIDWFIDEREKPHLMERRKIARRTTQWKREERKTRRRARQNDA